MRRHRNEARGYDEEYDYDDRWQAAGSDLGWQGAGSGHPSERWWPTARHDRMGQQGWRSREERGYDELGSRGLRGGGRQGRGRAWGMGGNVEMESGMRARTPDEDLQDYSWSGRRTVGMEGERASHYGWGMAARTDMDGMRGMRANRWDVDLGPIPFDSLRGGSRAGRGYGHRERNGERYLSAGPFRAHHHEHEAGEWQGRERYPDRAHVSYGEEYTERGRGPRGAFRSGEYAAEYGSGAYGGRSPRRGGGYSPRRPWQDESKGGTGYGAGYTRGGSSPRPRMYDDDYGDV